MCLTHELDDAIGGVDNQPGGNQVAQTVALALKQIDIAGLGNTGNRFIVELENGKSTVQLQKVLNVLDLLGLEVVVRPKTTRAL